jgi:hypothetical protein
MCTCGWSDPDPGAEPFAIGGDPQHRFGRDLKQQTVDDPFVVVGDVGDL